MHYLFARVASADKESYKERGRMDDREHTPFMRDPSWIL